MNVLRFLRRCEDLVRADNDKILQKQARHDAAYDTAVDGLDEAYAKQLLEGAGFKRRVKVPFAREILDARSSVCHLPEDRLFSKAAIRTTCDAYGLVFKASRHYEGALDQGLAGQLKEFKRVNLGAIPAPSFSPGGDLSAFWVLARPAGFSKLNHQGLVCMFCAVNPVGADPVFYLVHYWGKSYGLGRLLLSTLSRARFVLFAGAVFWLYRVTMDTVTTPADRDAAAVLGSVAIVITAAVLHFNTRYLSPVCRARAWLDRVAE